MDFKRFFESHIGTLKRNLNVGNSPFTTMPIEGKSIWIGDKWYNIVPLDVLDIGDKNVKIKIRDNVSPMNVYKKIGDKFMRTTPDCGQEFTISKADFDKIVGGDWQPLTATPPEGGMPPL